MKMTKNRTKRSLLCSILSMLLCVAMLAGTTFAWFTDSVTSSNNIIKSGTLDMTFEYWDGNGWTDVTGSSQIFDANALWEPGYTKVVYFKVANVGDLAFKYQLGVNIVSETGSINKAGEQFKLSDYIYFDVAPNVNPADAEMDRAAAAATMTETTKISAGYSKSSTLLKGAAPEYIALVVYMPESVGNDANYDPAAAPAPVINLGINAIATQVEAEEDVFDEKYDAEATYPEIETVIIPDGTVDSTAVNLDEFTAYVPAGADGGVYTLAINNKKVETKDGLTTMSFDMDLLCDGVKVAANGTSYLIEIEVGEGMNVTEVTHNASPVIYSYDPITGILSFETDSFSPFAIAYEEAGEDSVYLPLNPEAQEKLDPASNNGVVAVDENGNAYKTLKAAIESGASKLYFKEGVDLGTVTHLDLDHDVLIFGNGAYISGGERDFAIDFQKRLTKDVTVTVYNLHGVAFWGGRATDYTLNVNLYNCNDLGRVYLSGTAGTNNYALYNCTANAETLVGDTVVYSNANGTILLDGCTVTGVGCPVNLNHKVAGMQTVIVKNSTFVDCATEGTAAYYAPIRLYNSAEGAQQSVTVAGNTFTYSEGKAPINKADVLLNVKHDGKDATGTITADVQADATASYGVNVDLAFTVSTAAELYAVAAFVNKHNNNDYVYRGATVKLMNDIDLGGAEWTPIADDRFSGNRFAGTFDGQGYTVSNFKITQTSIKDKSNKIQSSYGFIGNLDGTLKNLTVENVLINGAPKFIGVLVGRLNSGLIDNCKVVNSVATCNNWQIGGLVGQANNGVISNCIVEGTTVTGYAGVGAIAGFNQDTKELTITNCKVKDCVLAQSGSFGESYDTMFAAILGCVNSANPSITISGCTVEGTTIKGVASKQQVGYIEEGATVTLDGATFVRTLEELEAAIASNSSVVLYSDIEMTKTLAPTGKSFKINGNGKTITQAADCNNAIALFDVTGGSIALENITFVGIQGGAIVRTVNATFYADSVTVQNCTHTEDQGLLRLLGKSTIKNSNFLNNTCSMLITLNYDGVNSDDQVVENCLFEGNACTGNAVLYYVKGASATIDGCSFVNNTLNVPGENNGAIVYIGFRDDASITNCLFTGNRVYAPGTSRTRLAGAIMLGDSSKIEGNAFIDNTVTSASTTKQYGSICSSAYYGEINLSGNYWSEGGAPVEGKDYHIEYDNYATVINSYATSYTVDADGVGVTVR